jgi:hypothetical protein
MIKGHLTRGGFMSNARISMNIIVVAACAVLISIVLPGCSSKPIAPEQTSTPLLLHRNPTYPVVASELYTETTISAASGGTLSLIDVQLTFPPNALASDTLISIRIPDINVFENHFGTDGLFFNMPVQVVMNYRDADLGQINEEHIRMAWYNCRTNSWDIIPCALDTVNKTVTANVWHFSAYALISDDYNR